LKILIADDSELKITELKAFFESGDFCMSSSNIYVAKSFKTTVNSIVNEDLDLVILDMTMPAHENSKYTSSMKPRALAGKDVLATVNYNRIEGVKFIIFSQFGEFGRKDDIISLEDICADLFVSFPELVCGFVKFNSASSLWKKEMNELIKAEFLK